MQPPMLGLLGNISPILGEVPSGEYQWCQTPRQKRAVGVTAKLKGCFLMTIWFWSNKIKNCKACKGVAMCIYIGISINVSVGRTNKSGNWASPLLKWPSSQLYNPGSGRGGSKKKNSLSWQTFRVSRIYNLLRRSVKRWKQLHFSTVPQASSCSSTNASFSTRSLGFWVQISQIQQQYDLGIFRHACMLRAISSKGLKKEHSIFVEFNFALHAVSCQALRKTRTR